MRRTWPGVLVAVFAVAVAGCEERVEVRPGAAQRDEAYLKARDLVREQKFDDAEAILKDLALTPNDKSGKLAKEFLGFEFPQMKATRLLQQGDTEGAQAVLRGLTRQDLTAEQMAATQRQLDSATVVGFGNTMMRTTALKSAARMIQVYVHSSYADNGQFPASLSLNSPELASLRGGGSLDAVGSIDEYRATTDTFSLIVTGKDPRQRIQITHEGIRELP